MICECETWSFTRTKLQKMTAFKKGVLSGRFGQAMEWITWGWTDFHNLYSAQNTICSNQVKDALADIMKNFQFLRKAMNFFWLDKSLLASQESLLAQSYLLGNVGSCTMFCCMLPTKLNCQRVNISNGSFSLEVFWVWKITKFSDQILVELSCRTNDRGSGCLCIELNFLECISDQDCCSIFYVLSSPCHD